MHLQEATLSPRRSQIAATNACVLKKTTDLTAPLGLFDKEGNMGVNICNEWVLISGDNALAYMMYM